MNLCRGIPNIWIVDAKEKANAAPDIGNFKEIIELSERRQDEKKLFGIGYLWKFGVPTEYISPAV